MYGDSAEEYKRGEFSNAADTIKQIAACYNNLYFIDGIKFIPKNAAYYRYGYLHPNDKGFELYANALTKEYIK